MSKFRLFVPVFCMLVLVLGGSVVSFAQDEAPEPIVLTIIDTSDEHGWLESYTPYGSDMTQGGAPMIYNWWVIREGYDPTDDSYILLSDGDNWTGPAITTWFSGEPMVEMMNWMGYTSSVVGNHEFDFGREAMNARFAEAEFPYLAANIVFTDSGEPADFAVPYIIHEAAGVKVGIIGLAYIDTPTVTHPENIKDLTFAPYAEALDMYVPQMKEEGAELIIVVAHACMDELTELAATTEQPITAYFAGHCHEMDAVVDDVPILGSGEYWRSYTRLTLTLDPETHEVMEYDYALESVEYPNVTPNADVAAMLAPWQEKVAAELDVEIGYMESEMVRYSPAQQNWVTDSWLWAFPQADVAITNMGGLRQAVDTGSITIGDVVGVLPFDNRIYQVEITGEQLAENLARSAGAVGGIRYTMYKDGEPQETFYYRNRDPEAEYTVEIEFLDGREFDPEATYLVLVTDFVYFGGDDYLFSEQNADAYDTGVHWRQPVIDYTESLGTTADNPLDGYLDDEPRDPGRE